MPRRKRETVSHRPIESYEHRDKARLNNPPVGLVTPETDPDAGQQKQTYAYDPHLDPQLVWAGKAEHTSFEVPTVSLHVHERIDPRTIIEAVRKRTTGKRTAGVPPAIQLSLFETERSEPLRQAIEFYQHAHGWSNRLIAGDSLLVMNSLLEKEGLAGKVQMIYLDPPYGIKYGSNFQPFVNKRDVKDGKDEDLTAEPEQIKAFRDTWELGIHSYLTYLRDRLLLARELLTESGSIFVQISDENVHHVRELMDEVFGASNFMSLISFRTKIPLNAAHLPNIADYLIWYAADKAKVTFRRLYVPRDFGADTQFSLVLLPTGEVVNADNVPEEHERSARFFSLIDLMASGYTESCHFEFRLDGRRAYPNPTTSWKTTPEGMARLIAAGRVRWVKTVPRYVFFADDYPVMEITNQWVDTQGASGKAYVVQTAEKIIQRCLLMTTDPGDLVFDPTCGSGTTAYVAEQWGRRWITCDTSRVALTLAKQRLMTAVFDYYELAHPEEGVGSGFRYKTVPHVTLGSIANNPEIDGIHARWQARLEPLREQLNALLGQSWEEWQIPRQPGDDWPPEARKLLADWQQMRRKRQEEIDAAIARHADQETLYDQPFVDRKRVRVSGPFTVEAVPAPVVKSVDEFVAQASSPAPAPTPAGETPAPTPAGETPAPTPAGETPALLSGWHSRGYLPHLKAEGGTYFVTFRLADSLPRQVLESWIAEREEIVKKAKAAGRELTPAEQKRLAKLHSQKMEQYLDSGRGQCWLKYPEIAELVVGALRHFDGQRYHLHAWVVMPNHVHVVVTPVKNYTLSSILHSWKSFTAHEVQKVAQTSRLPIPKGEPFWQPESYDHLVRNEADFARACEYTLQNPVKAGLCQNVEDWPYSGMNLPPVCESEVAGGGAGGGAGEDVRGTVAGADVRPTRGADLSIARSGETLRQAEWRDELLKTGIRGKAGQYIRFSRLEPLPGCRYLHAEGETRPSDEGADSIRERGPAYDPLRVVVSFGPEHAPLEQRQVEQAIQEAQTLVPRPKLIVFAAFQFDPEAAKDIDETHWPGVTLLKAQMSADLLTDDLKKKRAGNESFWLIGQPDVEVRQTPDGQFVVEVHGFDYYNTKTGGVESGGKDKIALWLLDTDYDGRSLYPRQVFFPMAGENEGWAKLARNLKAEIDEDLIEAYRGTVSLPFEAGENRRIAVKIVDDRGIESLKVMELGP